MSRSRRSDAIVEVLIFGQERATKKLHRYASLGTQ